MAMLIDDAFLKDVSAGLEPGTTGARRFLVQYMFLVIFTYGSVLQSNDMVISKSFSQLLYLI
jgi:hypothetical protein